MNFISPRAGKSYQKCNISPEWLYSLLPHFQSIVVNCVWWFVSWKQTYSNSTVFRVFWWTILISLCLLRKKTWKNIASYEIVILIRDALLNIMTCVYILEIFLFFSWCFVLANSILLKTKNTMLIIEFPLVSQPLTDDGPLQALLPPWKFFGCGLVT
jgi:hypothetical protein